MSGENGLYSYGKSIGDLIWAFIISFVVLVGLAPLYKSKKSFFDAVAARNVLRFLRIFLGIELCLNCLLLYMYCYKGEPIQLHAITDFGTGFSWIYGFPRPTCGIIFISFGFIGEYHFIARLMFMFFTLLEIACDAISAIQIQDLIFQIEYHSLAISNYSLDWLTAYYWRELLSFGICIYLLFLGAHFTSIVGWCEPPFITYRVVSGGDADRCQVMRDNRESRMGWFITAALNSPKKAKSKRGFHILADSLDKEDANEDNPDAKV